MLVRAYLLSKVAPLDRNYIEFELFIVLLEASSASLISFCRYMTRPDEAVTLQRHFVWWSEVLCVLLDIRKMCSHCGV